MRVPWTARKSNQSILNEISPGGTDVEAETPILWPPHVRVDSLEKTLMLGGIGAGRRRERQRMRWLDRITDWMDLGLGKLWKLVLDGEAWSAIIHVVN